MRRAEGDPGPPRAVSHRRVYEALTIPVGRRCGMGSPSGGGGDPEGRHGSRGRGVGAHGGSKCRTANAFTHGGGLAGAEGEPRGRHDRVGRPSCQKSSPTPGRRTCPRPGRTERGAPASETLSGHKGSSCTSQQEGRTPSHMCVFRVRDDASNELHTRAGGIWASAGKGDVSISCRVSAAEPGREGGRGAEGGVAGAGEGGATVQHDRPTGPARPTRRLRTVTRPCSSFCRGGGRAPKHSRTAVAATGDRRGVWGPRTPQTPTATRNLRSCPPGDPLNA